MTGSPALPPGGSRSQNGGRPSRLHEVVCVWAHERGIPGASRRREAAAARRHAPRPKTFTVDEFHEDLICSGRCRAPIAPLLPAQLGAAARGGGKVNELPCHRNLKRFLDEWLEASGLLAEADAPLFPSLPHGRLAGRAPLAQANIHVMIQRRAPVAGTTGLYDRRNDDVTLDEIERIAY